MFGSCGARSGIDVVCRRRKTYLEHVKQRGLSGVIEAQEEQLGVFVEQTQRRQDVVD